MDIKNPLKDRYYLLQKIGKGGMGEVYKAKDQKTGLVVAVKLLHPHLKSSKNVNRFKREAEYLSRLSHPNIVKFYSFEEDEYKEDKKTERYIFLVMEYIVGRKIRRHALLSADPIKEVLAFTIEICKALEYAHSMNVIHRDIKPENILITADSKVKILDFGIARRGMMEKTHIAKETKLTPPGTLLGTIQYLAPEYIQGEELTPLSDLYSLGVTLYELLTEQLPFSEGKSNETFFPQLFEEPSPPTHFNPDIPPELELTILKLLEKKPDRRFESAEKLKSRLTVILKSYELKNRIG